MRFPLRETAYVVLASAVKRKIRATLVRTWGTPVDLSAREGIEGECCGIPHLPKSGRCGAPGVDGGDRAEKRILSNLHLPPASRLLKSVRWDDPAMVVPSGHVHFRVPCRNVRTKQTKHTKSAPALIPRRPFPQLPRHRVTLALLKGTFSILCAVLHVPVSGASEDLPVGDS
jgi:hypothetical protein